jgi:hypothetical protein
MAQRLIDAGHDVTITVDNDERIHVEVNLRNYGWMMISAYRSSLTNRWNFQGVSRWFLWGNGGVRVDRTSYSSAWSEINLVADTDSLRLTA